MTEEHRPAGLPEPAEGYQRWTDDVAADVADAPPLSPEQLATLIRLFSV